MPIYDYGCRNCGHRVEVIHGVNASGPTACERCGGPMRKLLTTPSIVFKGSGWAKKDRSSARPTAKSDETKTTDGSADSTPKTDSSKSGDTAPAAATETKTAAKDTKSTGGTGPTN